MIQMNKKYLVGGLAVGLIEGYLFREYIPEYDIPFVKDIDPKLGKTSVFVPLLTGALGVIGFFLSKSETVKPLMAGLGVGGLAMAGVNYFYPKTLSSRYRGLQRPIGRINPNFVRSQPQNSLPGRKILGRSLAGNDIRPAKFDGSSVGGTEMGIVPSPNYGYGGNPSKNERNNQAISQVKPAIVYYA